MNQYRCFLFSVLALISCSSKFRSWLQGCVHEFDVSSRRYAILWTLLPSSKGFLYHYDLGVNILLHSDSSNVFFPSLITPGLLLDVQWPSRHSAMVCSSILHLLVIMSTSYVPPCFRHIHRHSSVRLPLASSRMSRPLVVNDLTASSTSSSVCWLLFSPQTLSSLKSSASLTVLHQRPFTN